jgi:hypothetical protein
MKAFIIPFVLLILAGISGCKSSQKPAKSTNNGKEQAGLVNPVFSPGPPVIIYKTKSDYRDKVAVTLTEDKSKLSSFPAPSDLIQQGELALPVELADGFLLDQRGINEQVAFLSMTYADYNQLAKTPSTSELMDMILDADPLVEMHHCGNRQAFTSIVDELNTLIRDGKLDRCRRLK